MYKMQRLEVSGAVRPIYGSLGVKRLRKFRLRRLGLLSYAEHLTLFPRSSSTLP